MARGQTSDAVGVELPEFADAGALPAAHRGQHARHGARVRQLVSEGPAADLSAVELEVLQAQHLRRRETVRTGRHAAQPLGQ